MSYSSSQGANALHYDIAVVGRGPIGASAALALQQADVRVAWVGRDNASTLPVGDWDSRVYALSDAARQLLTRLKVWDALARERIAPVYDMRVFPRAALDQERRDELHFAAYEARTEALAWIIESANLVSTLKRAIGFSSVQTIETNLVALDRSDERAVVLKMDDGRSLRAKLVVGADGAGSVTREQAGIISTINDYPQTAVVANFACTAPHADSAWQWFGAHGVLALLPLPGRHCSMVWSAPHALAHELMAASGADLAARVTALSGQALGQLQALSAAESLPLRRLTVDHTVLPRIALVGDAAHVIHPLAGQGMNLGFADVAALANVLAQRESFRDIGDHLLLRRYERQRKEPVLAISTAVDSLQKLFDPDAAFNVGAIGKPLQTLRDLGWNMVARSDWIKRQLISLAAA